MLTRLTFIVAAVAALANNAIAETHLRIAEWLVYTEGETDRDPWRGLERPQNHRVRGRNRMSVLS